MGRLAPTLLAAIAVALLAACATPAPSAPAPASSSAPSSARGPVTVALVEWSIAATPATAAAGRVTLLVRNEGQVPHDLLIIRSDRPPGGLATVSGRLDETNLTIVGRTGQLTPGSGEPLTADLTRGTYVLVCNVVGHYNSGQFASFTVH